MVGLQSLVVELVGDLCRKKSLLVQACKECCREEGFESLFRTM